MTTTTIEKRIARGIELKRTIATLTEELKEIKSELIEEASEHKEEHNPTEGGGWSWERQDATGNVVRVTEPARKLKSTFNPESKTFPKIRELAGGKFSFLFAQIPAYAPVDDFRNRAVAHLGRDAQKLIKLCTTDSETQVAFEVARTEAA